MVTNPNNSPYWITHLCILLLLLASLTATHAQSADTPVMPGSSKGFVLPLPAGQDITRLPVRKHDGEKVPREWIDKIHKAAPGDDWQAIEAHSIRQLLAAKKSNLRNDIPGTWAERGPSNIPGRIVDLAIDYTHNHLYAHSDHGIIFRSDNLEGSNWTPLNDQHPLGLDVASQLAVFDDGHIVTTGWIKVDNFWGVYHS